MSVHVLIATVPERRTACAQLLSALAHQTYSPECIHLVLDGYGALPEPAIPESLYVQRYRRQGRSGPGGRWRIVHELPRDSTVVVVDDDLRIDLAPHGIEQLAASAVPRGQAGSVLGFTAAGERLIWSDSRDDDLVCGTANGLALCAGDLDGLEALRERVLQQCGIDTLGDCGDDEALVSALLWLRGVRIKHVPIPELRLAYGTQEDCQTVHRLRRDGAWDKQRRAIAQVTGWPWHSH